MNKKLILASQSPRRRELIGLLGLPFAVVGPNFEEVLDETLPIDKQIEKLAYQKASSVFAEHPDNIIIGSDTMVVCDGVVLGKPKDDEDAKDMLRKLSGNTHAVITGVAIISDSHESVFSVGTLVTFNALTEEEINDYVATKEPHDKAGAYGIQGKGALFIRGIEGDYYSVMGLPVSAIYTELKNHKW